MAVDASSERGGLLERVTRREPFIAGGMTGALLERGWLDDGTTVIIKHVDRRFDWLMKSTGDDARVAGLWEAGFFDRVPASIDHATLDVQRTPEGAVMIMKDVSASLFDEPGLAAAHPRMMRAVTELHDAFDERPRAPLCALRDMYAFLSPRGAARFPTELEVPRLAVEGWSRFPEVVPHDVSEVIAAVHADPDRLADALLSRRCTVVHGDLKMSNLGATNERVVIVDWGTTVMWAPPAYDYGWYLAVNSAAVDRPLDRVLADIRTTDAGSDEAALRLALLGAFSQLGWAKALGATDDDEHIRQRERDGLAWWCDQVRNALPLMP